MIRRLSAAIRRLARWCYRDRPVSAAWLTEQHRADSRQGFETVAWQPSKLDYETWRPGR